MVLKQASGDLLSEQGGPCSAEFLWKTFLLTSPAWFLVAQVVQLILDGTSMPAVARSFAVSVSVVSRAWRRYQETGQYTRRRGGGRRRATTAAGPLPPPLCKEEQEEHCQSPAK
ncbi:hypothetical protein NFI96_017465 [Prochilodus magdalenae]|nr:hypothetical protein NFI96_017465 [Prochilodus magdalenae]